MDETATIDTTTPEESGQAEAAITPERTPAAPEKAAPDPQALRESMKSALQQVQGKTNPDAERDDSDDAPDPAEGVEAEGGEPDGQSDDSAQEIDPDELSKYRNALKRGQWADDDLDNLPPERLVEKGKMALKREKDQDQLANEYHRTKQLLEQIEKERQAQTAKEGEGSKPEGKGDDAPDGFYEQVDQYIKEVLEPLTQGDNAELYGDLREPLGIALTGMAERFQKAMQSQTQTLTEQLKTAQQREQHYARQMDRMELRDAARDSGLFDEYPELRKGDVFGKVVGKARSLANLDNTDYFTEDGEPRWDRLISDATPLVLGKQNTLKQTQTRLAKRQKTIADGQPEADSGSRDRTRSLSAREKLVLATRKLSQGADRDEVRRELATAG